ncbi:MAG: PEP-CTERM sorting domain-containing protein [Planctomycetota bacterium]|nr:MAG: PEP-CTERM sorting domain-containing protein [Planctomycetota bacterium]
MTRRYVQMRRTAGWLAAGLLSAAVVGSSAQALTIYENEVYATNNGNNTYGFKNIGPNPELVTGDTTLHAQLFGTAGFDTINTFSVDLKPYDSVGGPGPGPVKWAVYDVTALPGGGAGAALGTAWASGTFAPSALNTVSVYTANSLNLATSLSSTGAFAVVLTLPDQGVAGEVGWSWEGTVGESDVTGLGAHYLLSGTGGVFSPTGWKLANTDPALRDLALYVDGVPSSAGPPPAGGAVPEPATLALFALGAAAAGIRRWRTAR